MDKSHYLIILILPGNLEKELGTLQQSLFQQYGWLAPLFPCIPLACISSFPTQLTTTFRNYPLQFTGQGLAIRGEYIFVQGELKDEEGLQSYLKTLKISDSPIPTLPGILLSVMMRSSPINFSLRAIHCSALSLGILRVEYNTVKWYQAIQWQLLWKRNLPSP